MWNEVLQKLGSTDKTFTEKQLGFIKDACREVDLVESGIRDSIYNFLQKGEGVDVLERISSIPVEHLSLLKVALGLLFYSGVVSGHKVFLDSLDLDDPVLFARFSALLQTLAKRPIEDMVPFLLEEFAPYREHEYQRRRQPISIFTWQTFWVASGKAPEILLENILLSLPTSFIEQSYGGGPIDKFPGLVTYLQQNSDVLPKFARKYTKVLDLIWRLDTPIIPETVVELAVCPEERYRTSAKRVILKFINECQPILKHKLPTFKKSAERIYGCRLIAELDEVNGPAFLAEFIKREKSDEVRDVVASLLSDEKLPALPALVLDDPRAKIPPELKPLLATTLEELSSEIQKNNWKSNARSWGLPTLETATAYLEGDLSNIHRLIPNTPHYLKDVCSKLLDAAITLPDLGLLQLIRLGSLVDYGADVNRITQYHTMRKRRWDFRELAEYYKLLNPQEVNNWAYSIQDSILKNKYRGHDDLAWKLFYVHEPDRTIAVFKTYNCAVPLLKRMAAWPSPPRPIKDAVWEYAIHGDRPYGQKAYRYPARPLINGWPEAAAGLRKRLRDKDAKVRIRVAEWLKEYAELYGALAPDVEAALKAEKSEQVKPYMLNSFEALGGALEPFLNLDKLEATAKEEYKNSAPEALNWIVWNQVPIVRWEKSGKPVPVEVLQSFLFKSLKLKEPDALVRRYVGLMNGPQKSAFAKVILDSWLRLDADPMTREEAEVLAKKDSDKHFQELQRHGLKSRLLSFNPAQDIEERVNAYMSKPTGESSASKGVLFVVGLMAGSDVVPPIWAYLKKWFGFRANQCKALLNMIALVDHPAAIQLLLAVRNKFRTKGIQEEAARLVEEVAERKGWTLDELADRTIPDAGFNEQFLMELSYGKRSFSAQLMGNFKVVLKDQTGKEIKALPNPNADDDKELASNAKKDLSNRLKELKAVIDLQSDRLYEAMCSQRSWVVEAWEHYLVKHPIVGQYVQSLVWAEVVDNKILRVFRPTSDGSYIDLKDAEVKLSPRAKIQLVHECLIDKTEAQAWTDHLMDYLIVPPFSQFGKHRLPLQPEMLEKTELDDFEGHLVEAFRLRDRATKLGYNREQAQDAGRFFDYVKNLPGLGITIELSFSGNRLPEENRLVALLDLRFRAIADDDDDDDCDEGQKKLKYRALKDVPAVLLAECWNDLATLSAEGTGFDPDWERKVDLR